VGRTLDANGLLAGSACGKRRRGRPLNSVVSWHRKMRRAIVMAFLLGVAFVLGQTLIYEPYIVPRLGTWHEVPWQWWLAALAPEFAVILAASWIIRGFSQAAVFCVSGALCVVSLQWIAGSLSMPSTAKLIEGGFVHFAIQFLALTVLVSAAVMISMFARIVVRRAIGAS
jgi:hypothetical protein